MGDKLDPGELTGCEDDTDAELSLDDEDDGGCEVDDGGSLDGGSDDCEDGSVGDTGGVVGLLGGWDDGGALVGSPCEDGDEGCLKHGEAKNDVRSDARVDVRRAT